MNTNADPNAGEVLGVLMERARMSPEQLAHEVGYSRATVYNKWKTGQAWKHVDSQRFASVFGVPEDIFRKTPAEAMLWLIENDRFNLHAVIDLTDKGDDRQAPLSGWTMTSETDDQFFALMSANASVLCSG